MTDKSCIGCPAKWVCIWKVEVEKWLDGLNWEFTSIDQVRTIDSAIRKDILEIIGKHCRWYP